MNWGVIPLLYTGEFADDAKIDFAIKQASALGYVKKGDIVVCTSGFSQVTGGTNLIRVLTLDHDVI